MGSNIEKAELARELDKHLFGIDGLEFLGKPFNQQVGLMASRLSFIAAHEQFSDFEEVIGPDLLNTLNVLQGRYGWAADDRRKNRMDAMMRTFWSRGALALALAFAPALACSDDLVDVPEEQPGRMYCMLAGGTWGHFADGTMRMVLADNESHTPAACGCFPVGEQWSDEVQAELNQLTLQECLKAAAEYDFVWDECQENYESGAWLATTFHPDSEDEVGFKPDDLRCADD